VRGLRVLLVERGKRWRSDEFRRRTRVFAVLWLPLLGFTGTWKITRRAAHRVGRRGLGGGSLLYGNTLYVPSLHLCGDYWSRSRDDWFEVLAPYYGCPAHAGVSRSRYEGVATGSWRTLPRNGRGHTFENVSIAAFQDYQESAVGAAPIPTSPAKVRSASLQPVRGCMSLPLRCQEHAGPNYLHLRNATVSRSGRKRSRGHRALPAPDGKRDGGADTNSPCHHDRLASQDQQSRAKGSSSPGNDGTLKLLFDAKYRDGYWANISDELGARYAVTPRVLIRSVSTPARACSGRRPGRHGGQCVVQARRHHDDRAGPISKGSDAMYFSVNVVP